MKDFEKYRAPEILVKWEFHELKNTMVGVKHTKRSKSSTPIIRVPDDGYTIDNKSSPEPPREPSRPSWLDSSTPVDSASRS